MKGLQVTILFLTFPIDENYCPYHHKQIKKQEKQNEFYETI